MSANYQEKESDKILDLSQNIAENKGDAASLLSALKDNDKIPFHMPGHKRNKEFEYLFGAQSIDVTEIDGTDNLHDPKGVLKDAMQYAASVFGAKATRFLVNGSTCGILAGMRATSRRGEKVIVARNCHKSVYNAIEILGLVPEYVLPKVLECGIYGSVCADDVAEQLERTGAKLVVITSPTYEGVISDVKAIADVCKKHDAILFVDEAHGAHLGFSHFAESARTLGADIVVNSLHKTLPSLTQTALLHVCTHRVDLSRLDESLAIFETSSPSYVLMASIDECVRYVKNNQEALYKWAMRARALHEEFEKLEKIKIFSKDVLSDEDKAKVFALDETKFVFLTDGTNFSGVGLANALRDKFGIELEMASANYAIAMTGVGDTKESFSALENAVRKLDVDAQFADDFGKSSKAYKFDVLPQKAFNPCEIDGLSLESADMLASIDRVVAENVWAYPPGAPILVKGEIMSKDVAEYLVSLLDGGVNVTSSMRDFPERISVVKD